MESLEWAKSILGDVDTGDLETRAGRLGSMRGAVIEVLTERRAGMLTAPLSVTVPGAVSVSYKDNLAALDRLIASLRDEADGAADGIHPVTVTQLASRWAR